MANDIYPNPFGWDFIEQKSNKTFMEQRDAEYKEPAEPVFQGNAIMSFRDNYEAPTPQIKEVDGYKSQSKTTY